MYLTAEELNNFKESGYIIKDVFPESDLLAFKNAVVRIISRAAKSAGINIESQDESSVLSLIMNNLDSINHDYIADISDFMESIPETLKLHSNGLNTAIVRELLELDEHAPIYLTNAGVVLAMPHDKDHTYTFHKDTFYTIPHSNYIQIWAPLIQNSTIEMGTLKVCPGSHKTGHNEQISIKGVPNRHRYQIEPTALKKYDVIDIELEPGKVLFFDSGLIHSSGLNSSKFSRFSLVGVYHDIENDKIRPPTKSIKFKGVSPEEYFKELYG